LSTSVINLSLHFRRRHIDAGVDSSIHEQNKAEKARGVKTPCTLSDTNIYKGKNIPLYF
jgi:hypothetical protein